MPFDVRPSVLRPVFAAAALLASLPAAATSSADVPALLELASAAEVVAVGTVLSVDAVGRERLATVDLERPVVGAPDALVTVRVDLSLGWDADLVVGRSLLMFLEPSGAGEWRCVSGEHGCLTVSGGEVERAAELAERVVQVAGGADPAPLRATLKEAAGTPFETHRLQAAALGELAQHLRGSDAAWLVGQLAPDRDPRVRAWAAGRLAAIDALPAAPAVAALLQEPEREVRLAALLALGRLDPAAATVAFRAALRDPETSLRRSAVAGLRERPPQDLGAVLVDAFERETDLLVRLEIAETLMARPDLVDARAALARLPMDATLRRFVDRKLAAAR